MDALTNPKRRPERSGLYAPRPLASVGNNDSQIISGHCRRRNLEWWFCQYGSLRGPAEKGFSRSIKYRGIISNPEVCEYNGQLVYVEKENKSFKVVTAAY